MTSHDVSSDSQADEILNQYQSILDQQQIGWAATRPFMRQLGVGGQGVVYLSVRQGADNFSLPVALKIFSPKCYDDADNYEQEMCRIAQVASRVARIQHDNLIDVQNVIKQDGIHLMEMEWVDGYDMRRLLTPDTLHQVRDQVTDGRWK
ncbi:MAG: serine/threonine protein kinase, partial [Planctomycetaceae bacterium]|nr:serine/threonine protein kinase [Planctomycetaceae bacterium]